MRKVLLKSVKELLYLEEPVTLVAIENPIYYRNLAYCLDNEILLSENDQPLDLDKYGLFIRDPFDLNINDPRLIKMMYKRIDKSRTDEINRKLMLINKEINDVVYELSLNLDVAVDIGSEIDFHKMLSAINLHFVDPTFESFSEMFIKYLKVNSMFSSIKVVFSFGLFSVLSKDEISEITKEVELLELNIVNFEIQKNDIKSTLIIDKDWCIL